MAELRSKEVHKNGCQTRECLQRKRQNASSQQARLFQYPRNIEMELLFFFFSFLPLEKVCAKQKEKAVSMFGVGVSVRCPVMIFAVEYLTFAFNFGTTAY